MSMYYGAGGKGIEGEMDMETAIREMYEEIYGFADIDDISVRIKKLEERSNRTENGIRRCIFYGGTFSKKDI